MTVCSRCCRQEKIKCRSFPCDRFHPDASAVALDNFLAEGQADAGARIVLAAVQALEDDEDAVEVFLFDADAVVPDGQVPVAAVARDAEMNLRRFAAAELDGVAA